MATGDWLLLRLPADAAESPEWVVTDPAGALLPQSAGADLATLAAGRQLALVVPAGDVALFHVQLPPGNETRLQQLAPYALEEQVSQDLDQLHFAVGARDAGTGLVPVAVADRDSMQRWLDAAQAMSLRPRALFAESDLAPLLPGHVTLVISPQQFILRDGTARPVALPPDDPQLALSMLPGTGADLAAVNLVVYATPADWPRHEAAIEALRPQLASLRVQLVSDGLLPLHAQGIAASAPVNLLQGAYKPQAVAVNHWRRWRVAAGLLVGLLLLHAAGSLWELRQLRQTAAGLDAEVERVYGSIFPGQRPGPAPRRALETRMRAAASGGSPAGGMMPLLAALAAARQNVPVATLQSFTFRPGGLQLRLAAPDAATLEQFSQALRAGGYAAQVSSGRQHEGGFEGQIDMTAAGS